MSNLPLIPDACDQCNKQSQDLSRCSRCKNQFYCSAECQTANWKAHAPACSALPALPADLASLPPMVQPTMAEAAEVGRIMQAMERVVDAWHRDQKMIYSIGPRPGPMANVATDVEARRAQLVGPELLTFFRTRPTGRFLLNSYPGRKPSSPYTLRHHLTLTARLFLLHDLFVLPARARDALLDSIAADDPARFFDDARHPGLAQALAHQRQRRAAGVRLFVPKIMAAPGELSAMEYRWILYPFGFGYSQIQGFLSDGARVGLGEKMYTLLMIFEQCEGVPGLLDMTL